MKICFATNNKNKLIEIQQLLPNDFNLIGLGDLGVTEDIPETGITLEENSTQKATYVFSRHGIPVFADDSGLEVEALNGEPGVYSARYAGSQRSDNNNMNLLLEKLASKKDRSARFRTVITYLDAGGKSIQFAGVMEGQIIHEKRGAQGFGYDPIFRPSGYDLTFAEMAIDEKNKISHRARAFKKFISYLAKQ